MPYKIHIHSRNLQATPEFLPRAAMPVRDGLGLGLGFGADQTPTAAPGGLKETPTKEYRAIKHSMPLKKYVLFTLA